MPIKHKITIRIAIDGKLLFVIRFHKYILRVKQLQNYLRRERDDHEKDME